MPIISNSVTTFPPIKYCTILGLKVIFPELNTFNNYYECQLINGELIYQKMYCLENMAFSIVYDYCVNKVYVDFGSDDYNGTINKYLGTGVSYILYDVNSPSSSYKTYILH
jgi:hypothetical protein